MKRTLIALTALALFPLSVNAASLGKEKSEEIMYYGEVMDVNDDEEFIIKYQNSIFLCSVYHFESQKSIIPFCISTKK